MFILSIVVPRAVGVRCQIAYVPFLGRRWIGELSPFRPVPLTPRVGRLPPPPCHLRRHVEAFRRHLRAARTPSPVYFRAPSSRNNRRPAASFLREHRFLKPFRQILCIFVSICSRFVHIAKDFSLRFVKFIHKFSLTDRGLCAIIRVQNLPPSPLSRRISCRKDYIKPVFCKVLLTRVTKYVIIVQARDSVG